MDILRKQIRSMLRKVLLEQTEEKKDQPSPEAKPKDTKPKGTKPKDAKPKKKKAPGRKKKAAPGTIGIATGAVGSGRFKRFVGEAGARAQKDPDGLMSDLGIKGGGADLEGVLSILNAAIHSNTTMGEAYAGATMTAEQSAEGQMINVVGVSPSGLDMRNGIKFISHTLSAAQNAGVLSLSAGIEINQGRNAPIVIYVI